MNIVKGSRWKHYKGRHYLVVGIARDESGGNDLEGRLMVIYHQEFNPEVLFARSIDEWTQSMVVADNPKRYAFRFEPAPIDRSNL